MAQGYTAIGRSSHGNTGSCSRFVAGAGSQARVLRGGAFNNNRQNVRAAFRNNNNPNNRNNNVGFRVVLLTSIPTHWPVLSAGYRLAGRCPER